MAKVLSLFSGCGGLDFGFHDQGASVELAIDSDVAAVDTYNSNFPKRCIASTIGVDAINLNFKPDIVIAGPPCQGFSTLGKRSEADPRNGMILQTCRIATQHKPSLIILENVTGLTFGYGASVLSQACDLLSEAGYFVEIQKVKTETIGLPQKRHRVILIARSGMRPFKMFLKKASPTTVGESLDLLSTSEHDDAEELIEGSAEWSIAKRIAPGQKLSDVRLSPRSVHTWNIPEVYGATTPTERSILEAVSKLRRRSRQRSVGDGDPVSAARINMELKIDSRELAEQLVGKGYLRKVGANYELQHTFNGAFRRLDPNTQSPTVDTRFYKARLFLHPSEQRGLSSNEAAALQGFPSTFRWPSHKETRFRLIGNAVPPPLSKTVAAVARELV